MRGTSVEFEVLVAAAVVVVTAEVSVVVGPVVVGPDNVVVLPPAVVVGEPESPQAASTRARTNEKGRIRRIHRG
jgi:hypothetical protein